MKKSLLIYTASILFILINLQAQYSTKGFSFQGYAIDGDDRAIASTNVTVKFTVYGTAGATTKTYVEEHPLTTDPYGIFSATVGAGTKDNGASNASFEELNFDNFDFKLKVEVKETSGGTYATLSDKTLNAVPYARSAANGVPVGTVVAFAGPAAQVPDGWLLCDGTAYNASTTLEYAQLFVAIGNTWGGTNNTDFKVPDLRGMFLRGVNGSRNDGYKDEWGATRTVGMLQAGSTARPSNTAFTGETTTAGAHDHPLNTAAATGANDIGSFGRGTEATGAGPLVYWTNTGNGQHNHSITINGGGDAETRPHNMAVNYIIKY